MTISIDDTDYLELFPWNHNLETGLPIVDEQHKQLIFLLNKLASYLANKNDHISLNDVFSEMAAYAGYHFKTEESIWAPVFGDDDWYVGHKHTHSSFMDRVSELKAEENTKPLDEVVANILKFLTHWLAYHILDSDKRMAKAVLAVRGGSPLEEAKQIADQEMSGSMKMLIDTVLEMYDNLSDRTLELLREKAERKRIKSELEASRKAEKAFNDSVMKVVPGMLFLIDENLYLKRWNDKVNEITGFSDREIENRSIFEFFAKSSHEVVLAAVTEVLEKGHTELEENLLRKDGEFIPCLLTGTLLELNGKKLIAGVGLNLSAQKEVEDSLRRSEIRLKDAQRLAQIGSWELDLNDNHLFWTDEVFRIFEINPNHFEASYEAFLDAIHPDDRDAVNDAYTCSLKTRQPYIIEHRLLMSDGRIKWVHEQCETKFDTFGKPIFSRGTVQDISIRKQREAELRDSEQRLQQVLATVPESIFMKDIEGRYLFCNEMVERVFDKKQSEIIGHTDFDLVSDQQAKEFRKNDLLAMESDSPRVNEENVVFGSDGHSELLQTIKTAVRDSDGNVIGVLGVGRNISDIRNAEKAYRDEAQRNKLILQGSMDGFILSDNQGQLLEVNPAFCDMLGYDREELLSMNVSQLEAPRTLGQIGKKIDEIMRTGPACFESQLLHKDGLSVEMNLSMFIMQQDNQAPLVSAFVRDISEERLAQKTLLESEQKYRMLIESSNDAIFVADAKSGLLVDANKQAEHLLKLSRKNIIGMHQSQLHPPEEVDRYKKIFSDHIRDDRAFIPDLLARRSDGTDVSVDISANTFEIGGKLYIQGVFRDITKRKETEQQLLLSSYALDHAVDAIYWMTPKGRFVYVNKEASRMLGYSRDELLELSVADIDPNLPSGVPPEMAEKTKRDGSGQIETIHRAKDGRLIPVEVNVGYIEYQGSDLHCSFVRDISERKQAEASLRKLSLAVEQADEAMLITDTNGIIEYINPSFERITGYSRDESLGNTPRILKSGNHDEVVYKQMWDTITAGKVWTDKMTNKTKDGIFYPVMLTISPIKDSTGTITNYIGIQQDMTAYDTMEQQFYQAQKMEAIGTLVGGIAHDFNNMLAGITGNLYLAKRLAEENPELGQKLENMENLSFRAADMIKQLLTFARKDSVRLEPLLLAPMIKETLKFLRSAIPESIQMNDQIEEVGQIKGDPTQLHQVLMNLISNARDALTGADRPCINILLSKFRSDNTFIKRHSYFQPGQYAHLVVQDNGNGIAPQHLKHIYEPFFSTKEVGKGTGLGLAMVFGAVKTHKGFVEVESTEGEGACFHVYLPLLEPQESDILYQQEDTVAEGSGETILLVDDEQQVLNTGSDVLESLGYRVLVATDGQQAVELFRVHHDEISLSILDIVMPNLGGVEAAEQMRRIKPDANIFFATGYDKDSHANMETETVLHKPFSIVEMSHLIRQRLEM